MRRYIFSVLLCALSFQGHSQNSNTKCIRIFYSGDQDKPYPHILLYVDGSYDLSRNTIIAYKAAISQENYDLIRKAMSDEDNSIGRDSMLKAGATLQFVIERNGETTVFLTPFLSRIRKTFSIISNQISSSKEEMKVKAVLQDFLRRLIYQSKLE